MVKLKITILNNGPWKIKFKSGTPDAIRARVYAVAEAGGKMFISEDIVPYVNVDYLKVCRDRGVLHFQEIPVQPQPIPVKPGRKTQKRKVSVKPLKASKKDKVENNIGLKTDNKSTQGGK